ncbi:hypothetical protein ACZ90_63555 [Streptomyces albus subsp. albus]|nr:hypothetical protein ACZ90_63555 [Streptomyces albus subsp. albus]
MVSGGRDGLGRDACQAVQALVQSAYEPCVTLGAAHGALQWAGQATVGFVEDDVGEGAGGVVFRQQVGGAADVGGDDAGSAGEQQGDLLEVREWKAGVAGPPEHGFDETLVELPVEGEFRFEASFGVVEDQVGAAHRCLAASAGPTACSSGAAWAVWARKRA